MLMEKTHVTAKKKGTPDDSGNNNHPSKTGNSLPEKGEKPARNGRNNGGKSRNTETGKFTKKPKGTSSTGPRRENGE